MVEADIHLKLFPKSILDTYKNGSGIWVHPYTVTLVKFTQDLGIQGHLWSENDAIASWLRLISTSDHFKHVYYIYKVFEPLVCCIKDIWVHPCAVTPAKLAPYIWTFSFTCCQVKIMSLCHFWGWYPPQTTSYIHIRYTTCLSHWYAVSRAFKFPL